MLATKSGARRSITVGVRKDVMGSVEYSIGRGLAFAFIALMFFALYKYPAGSASAHENGVGRDARSRVWRSRRRASAFSYYGDVQSRARCTRRRSRRSSS